MAALLVDPRGVEPLSENLFIQLSPSEVCLLEFPSRNAGKQALRSGSFFIYDSFKSKRAVHIYRCVTPSPKSRSSRERRAALGSESQFIIISVYI